MQGNYGVFYVGDDEIGYCCQWTKEKDTINILSAWTFLNHSDTFHVKLFEIISDREKLKAGYDVKLKCSHRIMPGVWSKGSITLEVI